MSGGKVSATKIYIDSKHNIFLHFLRPRPPPVALTAIDDRVIILGLLLLNE